VLNAHPGRTRPRGDAPALGDTDTIEDGTRLWADYCAGCHGETGRGDGPAAAWLSPRPTNLSEHDYTRPRLADVLWNGVDGSSMPGWRSHSAVDRAALANVVAGFSAPEPGPAASGAQLTLGQQIYGDHCVACHGVAGGGDGFAADDLPIPIAPTDFRNQRIAYGAALEVLRNGIGGTSMVGWTDRLTDTDIEAVAHYVRSLFEGDAE
jgi:mono/diheme cytochrome c family protein